MLSLLPSVPYSAFLSCSPRRIRPVADRPTRRHLSLGSHLCPFCLLRRWTKSPWRLPSYFLLLFDLITASMADSSLSIVIGFTKCSEKPAPRLLSISALVPNP